MVSENSDSVVAEENLITGSTGQRGSGKNNKGKVPERIHKAEREKLKREQLNEFFLDLANVLELTHPNNGKASILCEATRLLKDLVGQIDCLKKENASLLSESCYVTIENNELRDENSGLQSQVEKLQTEVEARVMQSKPDLNLPPPEFHQEESLELPAAVDTTLQHQEQAVIVVPLCADLHGYPMTCSNISKPHARYPTPTDSWPLRLLEGQQVTARK